MKMALTAIKCQLSELTAHTWILEYWQTGHAPLVCSRASWHQSGAAGLARVISLRKGRLYWDRRLLSSDIAKTSVRPIQVCRELTIFIILAQVSFRSLLVLSQVFLRVLQNNRVIDPQS